MAKPRTPSTSKVVGPKHPVTTLRSTSGAGFDFEDQISAWLQVKMLAGEPSPAVGGSIIKIQAQVSALGWHIDDLLVTAVRADGTEARLAISAKGNQQVSASGLPANFVELAWRQWRDATHPLLRGKDGIALVKRGAHPVFDQNWPEVKNACSGCDAALAISRIQGVPGQRAIFDSVRNAVGVPVDATDEEAAELIRHLHVLSADFQLGHSEWKNQTIAQCRRLLTSGDLAQAEEVWTLLVNVASRVRIQCGTVTSTELWDELRKLYGLRDHPDFARDWQTLAELTTEYKARNVQTAFSTGYSVALSDEKAKLSATIRANLVTVLIGDSGTGKSALSKSAIDADFDGWTQVWFGPDELRIILSAVRRRTLPLEHEIGHVLNASSNARNVLVLDAVERIDPTDFNMVRQLLVSILPETVDASEIAWRVLIVTQSQGWAEARKVIPGQRVAKIVELEALKKSAVQTALLATPSLAWLTAHDETVTVLTNLRILAWVVEAGADLGSNESGLASHSAIADRLWEYWTGDAADVQSMMMRLSKREAQFERSFSLSDLNPADAASFEKRRVTLPLRLNTRTNSIEFEHDLAADWARFQYSKQFAHDAATWAALAENPLWTNALRMLGQFLLRLSIGTSTAWDQAFEEAEGSGNTLAADLLLDALCLDPEAERLLSERVHMLLLDGAKRLNRLLTRFRHIGTIPALSMASAETSLSLYMEARFRTVIIGRWPPVLRFLIAHREKLESLVSVAVAKLLETWLNGTPKELPGGIPMPFRKEAAELVLAMARTVQVEKGRGVMYIMDDVSLYTAPLAGVGDLTEQVSGWALELSGRRKTDGDVTRRILQARQADAERRAERLEKDAGFREREQERNSRSFPPMMGLSRKKLPPWPLGAKRRLDMDFRKAALQDNGLLPLMRSTPTVAAEVLLALLIEDEPHSDSASNRYEIDVGLDFAEDGYPTIYWKSPFFFFLQIAPNEALGALISLVNFCTERWHATVGKAHEGPALGVTLQMNCGTRKFFIGTSDVFGWVQSSSHHNGNLFCALDALERWLTLCLESGRDITLIIDRLFVEGSSSAFLGLLTNIAKFSPNLLEDRLAPILTDPKVLYWDTRKVAESPSMFDALTWARSGQAAFDMAKEWVLAPHRGLTLLAQAVELIKSNAAIAERLNKLIPTWCIPTDPMLGLEFRTIFAVLDRANYRLQPAPDTGDVVLVFETPKDLADEIKAWNDIHERRRRYLNIPVVCKNILINQHPISRADAQKLRDVLNDIEGSDDVDVGEKALCRLALAAALIVTGNALLSSDQDALVFAESIVRDAIAKLGATPDVIRNTRVGVDSEPMKFAAYAAMHFWMRNDPADGDWEPQVLTLLTSGDYAVVGTIFEIAYFHRARLGPAWWRLLFAGLLWSALVVLAPRYGDKDHETHWATWLRRLRRLRLRGVVASVDVLDVTRVAEGCARLDYSRRVRSILLEEPHWREAPERRWSMGLDWSVLGQVFAWLINGDGSGDWTQDSQIVGRLWQHECERQKARSKEERGGEYDLPSQNFGYDLLTELAKLSVTAPKGSARTVWEPVLCHGPAAHYALGQFIRGLFEQLKKGGDRTDFEILWREMVEYALDAGWEKREYLWYRGEELLCALLGFGHESELSLLPAGAQSRMRDVYERWAKVHLGHDENCVARFSNFLVTAFGAPLRLDGLRWIAMALKGGERSSRWYRDGTGDALIELVNTGLNQNGRDLTADQSARQALIEIAGILASHNIPTALALQERIKLLR